MTLLFLAACTGDASDDSQRAQNDAIGNDSSVANSSPSTSNAPTTALDTLKLELEIPSSVKHGASVPIALHIDNTSAKPIELYLRGRTVAFDVVVTNATGDTVWHRLADTAIDASLQLKILAPSERLTLTDRWNQRTNRGTTIPPGEYTVSAHVLTDRPDPITFPARPLRIVD